MFEDDYRYEEAFLNRPKKGMGISSSILRQRESE